MAGPMIADTRLYVVPLPWRETAYTVGQTYELPLGYVELAMARCVACEDVSQRFAFEVLSKQEIPDGWRASQ